MFRRKIHLVLGITALIVGGLLYIIFRSSTYLGKAASAIWLIRVMQQCLQPYSTDFLKYYLPDFLWAFSLACMLREPMASLTFGSVVSGFVAFACGVLWECLQIYGVVSGTGDLLDIITYFLAGILSMVINYKECRK